MRKLKISAESVEVQRKHMYSNPGIKPQYELFSRFYSRKGKSTYGICRATLS